MHSAARAPLQTQTCNNDEQIILTFQKEPPSAVISWYVTSVYGCHNMEGLSVVIFGDVPEGKADIACRGAVWMGALTCVAILQRAQPAPCLGLQRARREQGTGQTPPKNESKKRGLCRPHREGSSPYCVSGEER